VARDPRYDVLFEPVKIGPVTAPNRFYQVPHCTGMGYRSPRTLAAMREAKAEGGWGVVCTEYCSIHPSSDDDPLPHASLWDESDVRAQALMVEKVHRHGALAGVELWHGGSATGNLFSREAPMGPWSEPADRHPVQCGTMDATDIRSLRRRHVDAARRAKRAGFDIVYVYVIRARSQFASPPMVDRTTDPVSKNHARCSRSLESCRTSGTSPSRTTPTRWAPRDS
jgi:dimethylamine/trimethylamine dehydrogenase